MNGRGKASVVVEEEKFSKFLYNKEKGTCVGRSAKSWSKIMGFYVLFYSCLAGFWIACLAVFLNTLDDRVPRYYGKRTIMGINPGLGYQPWLQDDPESTLITWNKDDATTYERYVNRINEYLSKYNNITYTRACTGTDSNSQIIDNHTGKVGDGKPVEACRFDLSIFEKAGCSKANDYGFKNGTPCVILSLNRMIGWKPDPYESNSVPDVIADRYEKGFVTILCEGTSAIDKEWLGPVTYIPEAGIDGKYYPYAVMNNYHQPIAMVKFEHLPHNKIVMVECRAYARNIKHDLSAKLGLVNFELLLEDKTEKTSTKKR
uniref:Sodium/potassium-transporting ATPase subunit beta n=1 Tax=Syphacia muris TaxID=451379 RepID=A0A0N5AVK0_9BILA